MSDEFEFPKLSSFSTEVTFTDVDPEMLGILTGGVLGTPPAPTFAVEVATPPRRRTLWEWLRRKPKHLGSFYYFPSATIEESSDE